MLVSNVEASPTSQTVFCSIRPIAYLGVLLVIAADVQHGHFGLEIQKRIFEMIFLTPEVVPPPCGAMTFGDGGDGLPKQKRRPPTSTS